MVQPGSIDLSSTRSVSRRGAGQFTYDLPTQNHSIAATGNADGTVIERLDYSSTGDLVGGGPGAVSFFHNADADLDLDLRDIASFQNCFGNLKAWGEKAGVCVAPCRCKNPEEGGRGCAIAGRERDVEARPVVQQLFKSDNGS